MPLTELGRFPFIASFLAGIATFVSPCVLPLIPAYLSFITGAAIDELMVEHGRIKTFHNALLFVAGFSLIFVLLGASAGYVGSFVYEKQDWVRWIGGIIVILFGFHIMGFTPIKFLYNEKRVQLERISVGYLTPFVVGMAFAVGWTPCVGPILSSILILASTQETANQGALLLAMYSLGLGVPFLITALFVEWALIVFKRIKAYYRYVEIVSGAILIVVGLLLLTNNWKVITGYFAGPF